jgi:hypothetical protein
MCKTKVQDSEKSATKSDISLLLTATVTATMKTATTRTTAIAAVLPSSTYPLDLDRWVLQFDIFAERNLQRSHASTAQPSSRFNSILLSLNRSWRC